MGEMINAFTIFFGKPEGNRSIGKPSRRWEDVRIYLKETGYRA
jgi:hypothetical protein